MTLNGIIEAVNNGLAITTVVYPYSNPVKEIIIESDLCGIQLVDHKFYWYCELYFEDACFAAEQITPGRAFAAALNVAKEYGHNINIKTTGRYWMHEV